VYEYTAHELPRRGILLRASDTASMGFRDDDERLDFGWFFTPVVQYRTGLCLVPGSGGPKVEGEFSIEGSPDPISELTEVLRPIIA
jgi:hypothetical protein